jgi:hypothetical protein
MVAAPMPRLDITISGELKLELILYGLPDELPPERELLAEDMTLTLGSSSAIVAHNLAALECRVGFISRIGAGPFWPDRTRSAFGKRCRHCQNAPHRRVTDRDYYYPAASAAGATWIRRSAPPPGVLGIVISIDRDGEPCRLQMPDQFWNSWPQALLKVVGTKVKVARVG